MKSTRQAVSNRRDGKASGVAPGAVVQEALQVTWLLKGHLKNTQIAYIRVGVLLARVRDEKLYAALQHPDLESYAETRLHLGRASLYRYLQVHDWIRASHPQWLQPKPKGFIPDLADVGDLIWIERELARTDLAATKRAALEQFQRQALDGRLRKGELSRWRRQAHGTDDGLKSLLSKLRLLRKRGAALAGTPPEVLSHLDAAIGILANAAPLRVAGLDLLSAAT